MTTTTTPIARPADPFANIPGAYDEDDYTPQTARTKTVRDNAAYAWRNRSADADQQVFASVPADLVHDYREALDAAAVTALDGPTGALVAVWLERGYTMLGCTQNAMAKLDRHIPDELYHEVWDAACARLDGVALAEAAGLGVVLLDYQGGE